MLAAWRDYLAHDNHGRGVVLIGHSQGAYILKHLVKTVIDRSPAERRLLVSAILLGGQVLAANGPADSGDFAHVPPCSSPSATGCAIAYSSFDRKPPRGAMFGRDASTATHVLCVNPANPGSAAAEPVTPLYPTALMTVRRRLGQREREDAVGLVPRSVHGTLRTVGNRELAPDHPDARPG